MRLAFVTFEYPPHLVGGAGTYAYRITRELADLGHEVVVFTPQGVDPKATPNVDVREVPINKRCPLGAVQFWLGLPGVLKKVEKEERFDIVHFNGTSYWFLNKISDAPMVVTIHHLARDMRDNGRQSIVSMAKRLDQESGPILPLIEKRALTRSTRVVTVSKFTRERIIRAYAVDPNKIGVVYNGSSHDHSSPVDLQGAEAFLSKSKGRKTVLFVGRLNDPRKGLDLLLHAMRSVLERTDALLIVAGSGDQDGVRRLSAQLGIESDILFTGFIDDPVLLGLYRLCDVYVCPSRLEGFGLTVLDAQLYGRKVVATRVGAIPEIAAKETMLVDPEDPRALASAIVESLVSPSTSARGPKGTADPVQGLGSWAGTARELIRQYEIALKSK